MTSLRETRAAATKPLVQPRGPRPAAHHRPAGPRAGASAAWKRTRSMLAAGRYLPIYVVCIAPAALLWRRPVLLALVYACCSVALLAWRHRRADLVYFFVPFVLGPLGELFAVRAGAWSYAGALPLPLWLPFVWGIAGLFMKNLSEALAAPDRRIWRDRASRTSRPDAPVTEPGGSIDRRSNRTREASRS